MLLFCPPLHSSDCDGAAKNQKRHFTISALSFEFLIALHCLLLRGSYCVNILRARSKVREKCTKKEMECFYLGKVSKATKGVLNFSWKETFREAPPKPCQFGDSTPAPQSSDFRQFCPKLSPPSPPFGKVV